MQKLFVDLTGPNRAESREIGESIGWTGTLAALVACGGPLLIGLNDGWSPGRITSYLVATLIYLALTQCHYLPFRIFRWRWRWLGLYLLLTGLACFAMISISGDGFIQPIAFTVPLVYASQGYSARRMAGIAVFYLGLMALGLWISDEQSLEGILLPIAGYGSFMAFAYILVGLLAEQATARKHSDQLTRAIAEQRDYLARLVEITATLTRNLDVTTVLEHVAAEGYTLARAGKVRVWLWEDTSDDTAPSMRLAAAVPATTTDTLSSEEQRNLHVRAAHVQATTLVLPLVVKGESIGALELRDRADTPFGESDVQLLQPFADAAAVALENARLYEQARMSATLTERNRLARELHDTIAQGLTAVTMQLEAAQRIFDRDADRARSRVERAHELARESLEEVRRSVWTLASPLIDGRTLSEALAEVTERFAMRTGLSANYHHTGSTPTLGHTAATQVLRIAQEALQNVEKHAQATQIAVGLDATEGDVRVWVRDDGVGFDPEQPTINHAGNGFGLMSLRERARLAGGTLGIESTAGQGTQITVTIFRDR